MSYQVTKGGGGALNAWNSYLLYAKQTTRINLKFFSDSSVLSNLQLLGKYFHDFIGVKVLTYWGVVSLRYHMYGS